MNICIICMGHHPISDSNPLTIEHIVPELIGGGLTAKNVCKHCNSSMGAGFEARAANNVTFQLPRFVEKIAGKNKKIPNPFIHRFDNEEYGGKCEIQNDLAFKTIPQLRVSKGIDGEIVEIIADKTEPHKIREMLKIRLKRRVKTEHDLVLSEAQLNELAGKVMAEATVKINRVEHPQVQKVYEVDEYSNQLVYIKIGYELAVHHFGFEYTRDERAKLFQACLYTQHVADAVNFSLPSTAVFGTNYSPKSHFVRFENGFCFISLFGMAYSFCYADSPQYCPANAVQYEFDYINRTYSASRF
ncbi:HNH endonuclease [Photobacterium kasasachensis]|uniref:HNH endonuclease n=1 Tax=Photobacterium kasasachensis TaxID=2910240 RepID=UPI003D0BE7F4